MAFYLYDAALLLYADEVVFSRPLRRWMAALGDGATLGGRYLAFPALIPPGSPVFRAGWRAGADPAARAAPGVVLAVVRPLRWHAWLLALVLFALVPLALALHAPPAAWLVLLALAYLPTVVASWYVARHRVALGLSRRDVGAIAVDVLACPPFALNLVRRVTLRCGLARSAPAFADAMLDGASRAPLQQALAARWALLAGDRDDARPGG